MIAARAAGVGVVSIADMIGAATEAVIGAAIAELAEARTVKPQAEKTETQSESSSA